MQIFTCVFNTIQVSLHESLMAEFHDSGAFLIIFLLQVDI